jgi:hypothetical protein
MNWVKMAARSLSISMAVIHQEMSRSGFEINRECKGSTRARRTMQACVPLMRIVALSAFIVTRKGNFYDFGSSASLLSRLSVSYAVIVGTPSVLNHHLTLE